MVRCEHDLKALHCIICLHEDQGLAAERHGARVVVLAKGAEQGLVVVDVSAAVDAHVARGAVAGKLEEAKLKEHMSRIKEGQLYIPKLCLDLDESCD